MTKPVFLWVYAIRYIRNGELMPARVCERGGWSYWEPGSPNTVRDPSPRIFIKRSSAVRAAAAWSAGPWEQQLRTEGDWETGYHDYLAEPAPSKKDHGRSYKDLEIVKLRLQEVPQ